ncbi:MAG: DUF1573 domain-containing protein [Candidatus Hydrogenedentes bacterium]|nr:DUF1573 domain-containing protein [Candidatus Hydrogenedentota bacterium]
MLFLSFSAVFLLASGNAEADASRQCAETVNLGLLPARAEIRFSCLMSNTSDQPVRITRVLSSCSCLAAVPDRECLPPGDVAFIPATLTIGSGKGLVRKTLAVVCSGRTEETHLFRVTGRVCGEAWASCERVRLPPQRYGTQVSREIFLLGSKLPKEIAILSCGASLDWIDVSLASLDPPQEGYRYALTLSSKVDELPLGRFRGNIHVDFDGLIKGRFSILVLGEVTGHVAVDRNPLNLGIVHSDVSVPFAFTIVGSSDRALRLAEVRSRKSVSCAVPMPAANRVNAYVIKGAFIPPSGPHLIREKIQVQTNYPEQPVLELELMGVAVP